ncbi:MAG: SDR family oxidoreductase [Parvularculaceae bacterium]
MTEPLESLFSLEGRTIVVTGGYGQIGRALTAAFVDAGAKVAVIEPDADADQTERCFGALASSSRLAAFQADVTDRTALAGACAALIERFGPPHGLVNNAALDSPPDSPPEETGPFEFYPESSWDRVMDVNVKGVFLACQAFGAVMAKERRGAIVNVGSVYGAVSPDQSLYEYRRARSDEFYKPVAYAASKSALYNLTRYIAVYWGPKNVRANTVTFAGIFNHQDPAFLERYGAKIPLRKDASEGARGGMADPSDAVGPVAYLLSDAAGYMTGADLRVDGGFLAL